MDKKTLGIAAALVLLVGGGIWYANRTPSKPPEPATPVAAPTADSPPPLPSAEEADAKARAALAGLSARPELAEWAKQKDLVRRFVSLVDNVAEGKSPRTHVEFLAPRTPFTPRATDRWNGFADVVASVDAGRFAAAYKELKPLFDAAYREVGQAGSTFDARLKQALERVIKTPLPEKPPAVKPGKGALYVYADESLESLSAAEKQLLRMGPRNEKLIQEKAAQLEKALGL